MDRSELGPRLPGSLVEIPGTRAVLPDALPPVLEVDPVLLRAVDRARGAISEFVGQAGLVEAIHPFEDGNGRFGWLPAPLRMRRV
jgi:hypothetical protein